MNDKRKILTAAGLLVAVGTAGTGVAVAAAAAASDEVIVACAGADGVLRVPGDPTPTPTATPTISPTRNPSPNPTATPTLNPTSTPTISPTRNPSPNPTSTPTRNPTATPSSAALASSACRAGEREISWNRTGPQGPTGPAGPAGPDPFDKSVWGGLSALIPPQQEATWTGACPYSGLRAVSGGYEITDLAAPASPIPDVLVGKAKLEPFGDVPRRYEVRAKNRTDRTLSIKIHVLCVPE
ncbi:hypothetical protein [Nonomuraea bangladeshensis]|uniref:hypothetical protein n=1 Tax=Nonomuraea bangladeshensis TaxID=404385 RepID=UPI0031DF6F53